MSDTPKFYLQWNAFNVVTITLMWIIGMLVIGAVASFARQYAKNADADNV